MLKFLTENFNFITYGFEILAASIAIILYNKYKNTSTKYFIFFLLYIVFVELVGASFLYFSSSTGIIFLRSFGIRSTNWYNVFWMFGSVMFVICYYHSILKLRLNVYIIRVIAFLFTTIFIGHIIFNFEVFLKSHPPIYMLLGAFTTLICVALYFIEFLKGEAIVNAFKTFSFYASASLFIWWLIITPLIFFDIYNTVNDWDFVNLKRRIFLFTNMFMYSCFAIGLIVSVPEKSVT